MPKEQAQPRLTIKQETFVAEYLVDLNATQAAIRAGYSAKNADKIGSELLGKTRVKEKIQERMDQRSERTEITADRALKELGRIAFFDIRKLYNDDGTLKNPAELDEDAAAVLAGIDVVEMQGGAAISEDGSVKHVKMFTKKAKAHDKVTALINIMKHLGMFVDRHEHTGKDGEKLTTGTPIINLTLNK